MTDRLSPEQRSANMAKVRGKDTRPEMVVRRLLHKMGYRYRLHARDLPGRPDIVFRKRRKAIFVHGCFWHRHEGCPRATVPSTRQEFWTAKFQANVDRDACARLALEAAGWEVMVVWECDLRAQEQLAERLARFMIVEPDTEEAARE